MAITNSFNLKSLSAQQLYGIRSELFNQLAFAKHQLQNIGALQALLYRVEQELMLI